MNEDAKKENRLTLLHLLGIEEEAAQKILDSAILITGIEKYPAIAGHLKNLLNRTFDLVHFNQKSEAVYKCEVVIGDYRKKTTVPSVFIGQTKEGKLITSCNQQHGSIWEEVHPFLLFVLSCYCSALVLKTVVGKGLSITVADEIVIDIIEFIREPKIFTEEVDLGEAYMAGAGAIGNSFLYALSNFKVKGKLIICDPDFVNGGNLNRCLFFTNDDKKKKKVDALIEHSKHLFPNLELIPFPDELSKAPAKETSDTWLKKLIVGVDSRRARRTLQNEIPGEVFDASTTGIAEVVVHHHKQPLNGKACLGCIYYKEQLEQAHEKHVAEVLGVTIDQVNQLFVDKRAASLIAKKYSLNANDLIGIAYDTLFKQLCGEGKLQTAEDKQVLAPLAFVSGLAGALLALKFAECHLQYNTYNSWKLSPWANPNYRMQRSYPTSEKCEFCNNPTYLKTAKKLWP
jgi:molybdopterin/thiamine biosynthesis adenylyltransferase